VPYTLTSLGGKWLARKVGRAPVRERGLQTQELGALGEKKGIRKRGKYLELFRSEGKVRNLEKRVSREKREGKACTKKRSRMIRGTPRPVGRDHRGLTEKKYTREVAREIGALYTASPSSERGGADKPSRKEDNKKGVFRR